MLSDRPAGTKQYKNGHYIMPDTNALLNAMDLFEQTTAFYDVIVLQTVLEELRNRSLPLYNRLIGLVKSEEKRFYVFFNEFRLETYVLREAGESINDRNDRAVRHAAKWYAEHLQQATKGGKKKCPDVFVLTDDRENLSKAKVAGVLASSLHDYVSQLDDADRLLDMVASTQFSKNAKTKPGEMLYPEHYSISRMNTGVRAGTLHQGTFGVSNYNYLEASVHVPAFDRPLIVLGRDNGNRAVHGDNVVVEVLPRAQWKTPSTKILDEEALNRNDNPDEEEGGEAVVTEQERRALQEEVRKAHVKTAEGKAQPTARVVGVLKKNWRQYVGHVDKTSVSVASAGRKQQTVFLRPMDKRIPKIRLRTRQAGELVGKRILVTVDSWDRDSRFPVGHFVRSLGDLESQGAETEALLLEYDVQYRPFPNSVLDCLPAEGHDWKVPASTDDPGWRGRKDLRDLLVCSIDPMGCQDIDDALHARPLPNGNLEVGVHIADVSHFVKPDNSMDAEASVRGTTVYLVDKRIDMLPSLLGTDLCSLKPHVERYAFSTLWEVTPEADVVNVTFTKSVIRSREAFSYEQAQMRIDDASQTDDLTRGMRALLALSQKLRAKRMDAGALNLASPEVRVETESETSDPIDVKAKAMLATNSLVEEFMLLANISVAERIHAAFPQSALLRRHAAPPAANFAELAAQLRARRGMALDASSSAALAASLDTCVDPAHPFFNTLARILATRCMTAAEYFPAGAHAAADFRHYGLATPIYTHFTSPIRRYADLAAHRQLAAAIGYRDARDEALPGGWGRVEAGLRNQARLETVCRNLNARHRNAQLAGRASVEYYVGQALKGKVVDEPAYVLRVFSNGIAVFVPRFGIEGTIRLKDLASPEPPAEFDAETYVLKTSGSRTLEVGLFDEVKVRIGDVLEDGTGKRKLKMELLEP